MSAGLNLDYIDLHCDTLYRCVHEKGRLEKNAFQIDVEKLLTFKKPAQVFACFIYDELDGEQSFVEFTRMYEVYKNTDFASVTPVLSIENLKCVNDDLNNIDYFRECGVKIASLTWNAQNKLAGGTESDGGLTDFGRQAICELENSGITLDVSHLNEKSFYEVVEASKKPIIATHSNSKTVCPHKRNLTDEQFKIITDTGGIVGINLYNLFLGNTEADYSDILQHIEHFLELGGENSLALGTDFDGSDTTERFKTVADMPKLKNAIAAKFSQKIADNIFSGNAEKFGIN